MSGAQPRKVIHVITRLDWGGSAQNTVLTAIGHDRARFAPLVVAGRTGRWDAQGGELAVQENLDRLDAASVRWLLVSTLTREVSPILDTLTLCRLAKLFRAEQPTIVHTHTSKAGLLGRVAARVTGVPVVIHTPHGHVFYGHFGPLLSWTFLQIERALAPRTTSMIALTEAERDDHLNRGVGRADRFAVVPSGIELERFRRVAGARRSCPDGFGCPSDAVVVGSVGWLTEVKGHRILIEAAARMRAAHPRLHVVIVGSGNMHEELTALAAARGIGDVVHLVGERKDIPECLAAMDVFVLPSLNERMGRALVEAMAAGRPVVAARVGGVPAIVDDSRTGLLVPPGDPEALAAALERLLSCPQWAKGLGAAASQAISERFGVPAMVRAVESVYETGLRDAGVA